MKMHITRDDLNKLTETQKRRLSELWKPEKYDLVAAYICKDADNEEYDVFEFVIGSIMLDNYAHIYLNDIKAPELSSDQQDGDTEGDDSDLTDENADSDTDQIIEDEPDDELLLDLSYSRPICFNKEECVPLVNIGQMIDILQRNNFGDGDFFVSVSTSEIGCELGKNTSNFNMYGFNHDNQELCDVLWELLKTIL
jgi:hypothetical protein